MAARLMTPICVCLICSTAHGRLVENWPYERLYKAADFIVIATAVSTTDSAADSYIDERWPLEFLGQNTTLQVSQTLKGNTADKKIVVLHHKFGKIHKKAKIKDGDPVELIDSPSFVYFRSKPVDVEYGGWELKEHRFEYLLFLKKRSDGRYELVSGGIDPNLSVRELFQPHFSQQEPEKKEK